MSILRATVHLFVLSQAVLVFSAENETDRFRGFPPIHQFRPGQRTLPRLTSDALDVPIVRPAWTRAMGDLGGWPTMFRYKQAIYYYFPHVDAHRGKKGEASGRIVGYRSADEGRTWQPLPDREGRQVGEFVVAGDTLYRYDFDDRKTTHVSTSSDGLQWTARQPIRGLQDCLWLWGVTYDAKNKTFWAPPHLIPPKEDRKARQVQLVRSGDGLQWEKVSTVHAADYESESALRLEDDGTMVILIRRKYCPTSLRAVARPPYQDWQVDSQNLDLGGEHFFEIGPQTFLGTRARYGLFNQPKQWKRDPGVIAAVKDYDRQGYFSILYRYDRTDRKIQPWAVMDSMGDCSYPHLVETPTEILCAYYSQHEDGVAKAFLCGYDKRAFLAGPKGQSR